MQSLAQLNLIHLFDFYLAAMFLLACYRRLEQYRAFAGIAMQVPGRWPKLFELIRSHRTIFLTWSTTMPAAVALALCVGHTLAIRWIWPQAQLTLADLPRHPFVAALLLLSGGAMASLDLWFLYNVVPFDRAQLEGYFNEAEHWLRSWQAPVVRVLSLGYINPREMVHERVRDALLAASNLLNRSLWWTILQVGVRIAFGLALWLSWAFAIGGPATAAS